MALMLFILCIVLLYHLGQKGKAYREEKRIARQTRTKEEVRKAVAEHRPLSEESIEQIANDAKEDEYRQELKKQGYSDELITVILPTLMNDGK